MSKLLKKYIHHLHVLNHCKACNRNLLLKNSPIEFIKCICEVCHNLLIGNIPVDNKQKKQLYRQRHILRFLASKKNKSLVVKKRKLIQQGGALLPLLLPPLLTIAAELLPNLFAK